MSTNINDILVAKKKILETDPNKMTRSFIEGLFAAYHDKETNTFKDANFSPATAIKLTHAEYKWVDKEVNTTLGMLLFNRYILERCGAIEYLHYWNKPIDSKGLSRLNTEINNLVIIDKLTIKDLGEYTDSRDRLGFWCASFLSVSISRALILPMDNVNKRKRELFDAKKDQLNSDNPVDQIITMNAIEKELMGMVRNNLKDDPGYDMYASGDGNLDNNYKTINVTRGAVYNTAAKKYSIVENSLMDGISQKDIPAFANSIVAAAYPSAVGTADAGYMAKKLLAVLQSEHLNPDPNSDCGTKSTIPFNVTNANKQYVLFRYIDIGGGKRQLITLENVSSFVGKTIRLYSPTCCVDDAICGKCAGTVFHNLGVTQVGMLVTQITQKLLNLKLKSKHDLSQSAGFIDKENLFLHDNDYVVIKNGMLKNKVRMRMFIPRFLESMNSFYREATTISCMGIFPVKFYDKNDKVILSTMMTAPTMLDFNIYTDIQEDANTFIVTYDPESDIGYVKISKTALNVEFFLNQIYLNSGKPQVPYHLMTMMMFNCLEINNVDLTGPSITYELLARRVCRSGKDSFAKVYGKNPNVDPMSYTKQRFDDAVRDAGVLQGMLFENLSEALNTGLSATLDGIEPTPTPLEKVIRA